ncbi:MAG: pimeloyl-ACP methyl ester esterase BioH [Candidatus Malihini olakiniferum]
MRTLYWQTKGEGKRDLVLLHGWGLNTQVWQGIAARLVPDFCLHCVDLPGYGRSIAYRSLPLNAMADIVLEQAPEQAIWLGWSLGGLVASQAALSAPSRVSALITVASSPCFIAKEEWLGIKPAVLEGFQKQLIEDFQRTVERFLALQTFGTGSARQDARLLKSVMLKQPMPSIQVLDGGLEILRQTDLREAMSRLTLPMLRIYGELDGLVPRGVASLLDAYWPNTDSVVIPQAAHAPFISHPDAFAKWIRIFSDV